MSALRERINRMSNGALARQLGKSNAYVSYLMRGQRTPSLALARKMAEVLGCTIDQVLAMLKEKRGKRKGGAGKAAVTLREKAA